MMNEKLEKAWYTFTGCCGAGLAVYTASCKIGGMSESAAVALTVLATSAAGGLFAVFAIGKSNDLEESERDD